MTSRRIFWKCSGAAALLTDLSLLWSELASKVGAKPSHESSGTEISPGEWLDKAIAAANRDAAARKLNGQLVFGRFVERIFYLLQPIEWDPNPGQERYEKTIAPVGFVTDLASIPRVFYSLLPPDGPYTYPAIIHDFLYWDQSGTKADADKILNFGMEDLKINAVTRNAIYEAVHLAGKSSWDGNASLKAHGEKRILKRFPADPTTRWAEWKRDPNNFL